MKQIILPVYLAVSAAVAAGQTIESNVVYGTFSGSTLLMDVHRPANPNGYGIVYVSGSGWTAPLAHSAGPLKSNGRSLQYAKPLVNHRVVPQFRYRAAVDNEQPAVRSVWHNAPRYRIRADRMGSAGGSSGGRLLIGLRECGGETRHVSLVNQTVKVRPGESERIDLTVQQRGAFLELDFEVSKGRSGVRVAIMNRRDDVLTTTEYKKQGRFQIALPEPGRYCLVVDNLLEGRDTAECRVRAELLIQPPRVEARELPLGRRLAVIAASLGLFGSVAVYAGRKLWRAEPPELS